MVMDDADVIAALITRVARDEGKTEQTVRVSIYPPEPPEKTP
jgi:hypothetical protein